MRQKHTIIAAMAATAIVLMLGLTPAAGSPGGGKGPDGAGPPGQAKGAAPAAAPQDAGSSSAAASGDAKAQSNKAKGGGGSSSSGKASSGSSSSSKGKGAKSSGGSGSSGGSAGSSNKPAGSGGSPVHGCAQAGAGHTHNYASTCDGSASQNGNGGGKATGKPCAGCVGAADNKNPKGQHPNGSDRNKGYECDGNKGIGKGNPAHSGCKPSPQTTPTPSTTPGTTPGPGSTPGTRPTPRDEVAGDVIRRPIQPQVRGSVVRPTARGVLGRMLPTTGAPLLIWTGLSLGLMGAGVMMTQGRRRLLPFPTNSRN